jgi:cytochrome b561
MERQTAEPGARLAQLPASRYSSAIIAIHWLTLLLVIAAYASMELRELFDRGSDGRNLLKTLHYSLGLSVLLLVALRLVARSVSSAPPILPAPGRLQSLAAHAMHIALYLWMLGMPLLGWALQGAEGNTVAFYGLPLPGIMAPSEPWAERIEDAHETLGTVGYWLIGLHAAAALFHHLRLRDNTLRRMLPGA